MRKPYAVPPRRFRPKKEIFRLALSVLAAAFAGVGFAQTDDVPQYVKTTDLELGNDVLSDRSGDTVLHESVSERDAAWLRLNFEEVELGASSTLTVISREDGASQTLSESRPAEATGRGGGHDLRRLRVRRG